MRILQAALLVIALGGLLALPRVLSPYYVTLDLPALGLEPERTFEVEDLLEGERELWQGARHPVTLDPTRAPGRILRLHSSLRTERDFDYFA
jgi:starch synthase (maltosyl-transferring)